MRIALNLKGPTAEHLSYHLRNGEHRSSEYLILNPQGLAPTFRDAQGTVLTQSLPIIEWLDETYLESPLLPADPIQRARVRGFGRILECDTHPVQNLKVLARLRQLGLPAFAIAEWAASVNQEELASCAAPIATKKRPFCFGSSPNLTDLCRISRLANAKRFGVDFSQFPHLQQASAVAATLKAFANAAPDRQHDAE